MRITPNARQRAFITSLEASGGLGHPGEFHGKRIIDAFERYLTTRQTRHITRALYDYLTMRAGFIAHFNMHEFRRLYRDPADLFAGRHEPVGRFEPHPQFGPVAVYRDGMTSREVWERLAQLITEHGDTVLKRSADQRREADIAQARQLAARHGLHVVPEAQRSDGH
jgi:hypothetical protein